MPMRPQQPAQMTLSRVQFYREIEDFQTQISPKWSFIRESEFIHETHLRRRIVVGERYSIDFFIVYGTAFQAPVLYFLPQVTPAIGSTRILSVEESIGLLFPRLQHSSWLDATVSVGENPVNGLLMYFLHPCNTASFLKEVRASLDADTPTNYIHSWLSFVPVAIELLK